MGKLGSQTPGIGNYIVLKPESCSRVKGDEGERETERERKRERERERERVSESTERERERNANTQQKIYSHLPPFSKSGSRRGAALTLASECCQWSLLLPSSCL